MAIHNDAIDLKLHKAGFSIKNMSEILDLFNIRFVGKYSFYFIDRELEKLKNSPGYLFTLPSGRRDGERFIYYTETDPEKILKLGVFR